MTELADFQKFCRELTLSQGRPMRLEPFQRRMLADYFDGCRETLILVPKKQGKTTLLAALSIYHLLSTPDAAVYVAAASRDQATILFDQARGFIARSETLRAQLVVRAGYRELWTSDGTGKLRVLAAGVDTVDGVLPTLALVDELHRHKSSELYGVLADGLGPRNGRIVTISTAGDSEDSPLGRLRQRAYELPGLERDGAYRHVRAADFSMHEWALDPDEDRDDLEVVKRANPASWQTIPELRRRKDSPSMTSWRWARFACGVWLAGEDGAIAPDEWASCAEPGLEIPAGAAGVIAGLDLAWRSDTTALSPVWRDGERIVCGKPTVIRPPDDGTSIDAREVWSAIESAAARWPELTICADPNAGAPELLQRIERELPHVTLAEHPQAPHTMALAAGRLQELIATGRLRHPDDPELTAHVLAAVPSPVGEQYRLKKASRHGRPIDAAIAVAMAVNALLGSEAEEEKPSGRASWSRWF